MNKKWLYIKISIALFLIIWGFFRVYLSIVSAYNHIDIVNNPPSLFNFSVTDIYLRLQSQLLIDLLTMIGGILLMMSKRLGWHFAISACLVHILILIHSSISLNLINYFGDYILAAVLFIPFALIITALMQKPLKGTITLKDWAICFILSAIVSVNYLIFA